MKLLIHGTDLEKSREFYFEQKEKYKNFISLNGEGLTFDQLFQASENKSLFDQEIYILIENLFSRNKSNSLEIKKIIEFINNSKNLNLVLWESNEVTKSILLALKTFDIKSYIIPQKMFNFLDQIKPGNSKQLISLYNDLKKEQADEMILFMMIRQFRLMLDVASIHSQKIDEINRLAPWQVSKIKSQSIKFSKSELIYNYNLLFDIDKKQKTGITAYPLDISIDFFFNGL